MDWALNRFWGWVRSGKWTVCPKCGCEVTREDGCCCHLIALRQELERKDMIGRLEKWQRDNAEQG